MNHTRNISGLVLLLPLMALLIAGCAGSKRAYVQFRNGKEVVVEDWSFNYQYVAFAHSTCLPTESWIVPVRGKLSGELHVQNDQSEEVIILGEEIKSIRYVYSDLVPFALEVRVSTVSGEEFSFNPETFVPLNGYLTKDNCVKEKYILIKGVSAGYPHEEVFIDLGISFLSYDELEPYQIQIIEIR